MRTIRELNEKIWYRLAKVILIGAVFLVGLSLSFILYHPNYYDRNINVKDLAERLEGATSKEQIISLSEYVSNNNMIIEQITAKSDFEHIGSIVKRGFGPAYKDWSDYDVGNGIYKKYFVKFSKNQNLAEKIVNSGWFVALKYIVLVWAFLVLLTEIIRRAFYYIIFGKFFPDK